MADLSQFSVILNALPTVVDGIKGQIKQRADASAAHDAALAAEDDRYNKAINAANAEHTANVAKIDTDFNAAIEGLPADQAAAEAEYQDFLAKVKAAIESLPASVLPA